MPFDVSCYDDAPPATAADPFRVSAAANDLRGDPLAGVQVDVLIDGTVMASGETVADGRVVVSVPTGGTQPAVNGTWIRYRKAGYSDSVEVLPSLRGDSVSSSLVLYVPADWDTIYGMAGESYDAARGLVYVYVAECSAGVRLAGVSASFEPAPGAVTYLDSSVQPPIIDPTLTATTPSGNIYALNAPAGEATVTLSYEGQAFRSFTVEAIAGTRVGIAAQP